MTDEEVIDLLNDKEKVFELISETYSEFVSKGKLDKRSTDYFLGEYTILKGEINEYDTDIIKAIKEMGCFEPNQAIDLINETRIKLNEYDLKFLGANAALPDLMISGTGPSNKEEITALTKTTHLTEPNDAPDKASIILQAPPRPIVRAKDSDLIVSLDNICSPDVSHGNIILPPETIGIGDQFIEVVAPGLFLDTFLHITPTNNLELISPADNVTCVDASLFAHDFKDADVYMGNTIKPYTGANCHFLFYRNLLKFQ